MDEEDVSKRYTLTKGGKHNLTDTVDVRELHKGLLVQTKFADWITRRLKKPTITASLKIEVQHLLQIILYHLKWLNTLR